MTDLDPATIPHPATVTASGPDHTTGVDADRLIGRKVTIRGGFDEGIVGVVIANEPTDGRPYRYRVAVGVDGHTIGGLHPVNLDLWRPLHLDDTKPCPVCGDGPCTGSPRTAKGRDVDAWYRVHTPLSAD